MAFTCTIPAVSTLQRDDGEFRITLWDFVPGAVTGWHTHGWPYLVVMLTDAVMHIHDGATVNELKFFAGQTYDRPSGITHDVKNGGDARMAFVEIEIKRPGAIVFP